MATSAVMRTGAATPSGSAAARAARGTVGTGDGTAHSTGAATWRRNSRRGKTIPGGGDGRAPERENGGYGDGHTSERRSQRRHLLTAASWIQAVAWSLQRIPAAATIHEQLYTG